MATFGAATYLTNNALWGFGAMFVMAYFIRPHVVPSDGNYYYEDSSDDNQMVMTPIAYNPATGLMCTAGVGSMDVGGHAWGSSD